ncbi:MAG: putative lipid II flippase FtsW [Bifidobacteriaceae bacterium]|jgi:cell division protein FtsW|nr:putative lipid II flippase FtsW [Bifidobacteriaceae bacterium]
MSPEKLHSLRVAHLTILVSAALLTVIGLFMTMSAHTISALTQGENPYQAGIDQAIFAAIGVVIGAGAAHTHRLLGRAVAWSTLLATLVLQGLVVFTGLGRGEFGNRNWLDLGFTTIQPSEFIKFGLALWLGSVLAYKKDVLTKWSELVVPGLIGIAVGMGLVLKGDDAGTALVIGLMAFGALVLAGVPWSKLAVLAGSLAVVGAAVVIGASHRLSRLLVAYNPEACEELADQCWQIRQAEYSLASGGWFGAGLGASRGKWAYLSQAESDFIFAIIGEELGLVGTLTVLVLFGLLGFGLFQVVRLHPDRSVQIAVGTIGCWIEGQALINIGMVIKLLPVIGVPLPFVSAGGSALISCLVAIGVVFGLMRTDPEVKNALRVRSRRSRRVAAVADAVSAPGAARADSPARTTRGGRGARTARSSRAAGTGGTP